GSVTRNLLRQLPVPAITVSHDAHPMKLSRILFATDLSNAFREGLDFSIDLARHTGSELIVFHSIAPLPAQYGALLPGIDLVEGRKQLLQETRAILANIEAEGVRAGIRMRTELAEGPAEEKILSAVDKFAAELVIMTIQDKGIVERAVLGSTAERLVRDAKVPVLSLPVRVKTHSGNITERQIVLES
ncbi:MAG TPA: universal stress protein, partial [Terriglobia bacterium]|nr:universal stress protein [Terriglobia bacterium]